MYASHFTPFAVRKVIQSSAVGYWVLFVCFLCMCVCSFAALLFWPKFTFSSSSGLHACHTNVTADAAAAAAAAVVLFVPSQADFFALAPCISTSS